MQLQIVFSNVCAKFEPFSSLKTLYSSYQSSDHSATITGPNLTWCYAEEIFIIRLLGSYKKIQVKFAPSVEIWELMYYSAVLTDVALCKPWGYLHYIVSTITTSTMFKCFQFTHLCTKCMQYNIQQTNSRYDGSLSLLNMKCYLAGWT